MLYKEINQLFHIPKIENVVGFVWSLEQFQKRECLEYLQIPIVCLRVKMLGKEIHHR